MTPDSSAEKGDQDDAETDRDGLPDDLGKPDLYTLEFPADTYEDVTVWGSGKLAIEQTPEQRQRFIWWFEREVLGIDE